MKKILATSLFAMISLNAIAVSIPEFHKDMIKNYGLDSYVDRDTVKTNLSSIKIAVLERGFAGAEEEGNLPGGTVIVSQYDAAMIEKYNLNPGYEAPPLEEAHGRRVAQLVWAMTGMSYENAPKLYLLNANGYTNFRRAVRYAIEEKVDIILYAQNWEYGGNYDGKGFINQVVNEATDAGIFWINAGGNYGDLVHNSSIISNPKGYLTFSPSGRYKDTDKLFFTVNSDEKIARVLCTWNDFTDDPEYQSVKDLDLFVYEWKDNALGELVGESCFAQVTNDKYAERPPSKLAREEISLEGLRKNQKYAIMVKDISQNFSSLDKVRIIIHANSGVLTFDDHSIDGEIMIPADNKTVIAVGDTSSNASTGPTRDRRSKPDVTLYPWAPEGQTNTTDIPYATFSDDTVVAGTSADAAIFAGITAVLKADNPSIKKREILAFAQENLAKWRANNLPLTDYTSNIDSTVTPGTRGYYNYTEGVSTAPTTVVTTVCYNPVVLPTWGYFNTPIPPPARPPVYVVPPPTQVASSVPPHQHNNGLFRPKQPVSRHISEKVPPSEFGSMRHQPSRIEPHFGPRREMTRPNPPSFPKNEMDVPLSRRPPELKRDASGQNPYNRRPQKDFGRGFKSPKPEDRQKDINRPTPQRPTPNGWTEKTQQPRNINNTPASPSERRIPERRNAPERRDVNRPIPQRPTPNGWTGGTQPQRNINNSPMFSPERRAPQREYVGRGNPQPVRPASNVTRNASPAPRGISRDKAPKR